MNKMHIAQSFSLGQFDLVLDHFSKHIMWHIVGQQRLNGLLEVQKHCFNIKQYFETIEHDFKIIGEFESDDTCIIQGTATFISASVTTHIQACDIYTFDSDQQLIQIESYCITLH